MFARFGRSWRLMKQSYGLLMKDKELLLLPVLSGICILVLVASFVWPMVQNDFVWIEENPRMSALLGFAFYVLMYTIAFFFQAALIAGACERMSGGDPTLGSALGAAAKRLPTLFAWGIVAGTVGMILNAIQERSEWVGRIVAGLLGAAWSIATFFVVPVLVMEKEPLGTSFKRSWGLVKDRWGEAVIGSGGIGLATMLVGIPIMLVCGALVRGGMETAGIVVGVVAFGLLAVFGSALQGVYVATLYRYATTNETPQGFGIADIEGAFHAKA